MCKAFSGIVLESGEVVWYFAVDSHEDVIAKYNDKAKIKLLDDGNPRPWARFEIAPLNGNYINPNEWRFRLDENTPPAWWTEAHKEWCQDAHSEWLKKLRALLPGGQKIVNPLVGKAKKPSPSDIEKAVSWASVRNSVGASVGASARASVGDSVGASVVDSVWDSAWASVGASVCASVGDSVGASVVDSVWDSAWASVGDNVGDSVWDSVWAYLGSLFSIPRDKWLYTEGIKTSCYPFQPAVDLWNRGFVPSFDGNTWRLHSGKDSKIVYEWKKEEK